MIGIRQFICPCCQVEMISQDDFIGTFGDDIPTRDLKLIDEERNIWECPECQCEFSIDDNFATKLISVKQRASEQLPKSREQIIDAVAMSAVEKFSKLGNIKIEADVVLYEIDGMKYSISREDLMKMLVYNQVIENSSNGKSIINAVGGAIDKILFEGQKEKN